MTPRDDARPSSAHFISDGGEMGALIRAHDWSASPLGAPEVWPGGLKTAVRLILNTGHPMYIWWGPELICFYNDAYARSLGAERHPTSLGQPGRDVWAEIWPIIGPQIEQVMSGGGATWNENQLVPITRNGRLEDVCWTYSYSPIDDQTASDGVGGVLVVCTETTQAVLAERRRATETERQRRLFEQAPGFIAVLSGPEHVFEFGNAAYRQLIGGRETLGRTVRQALPEVEGQGFFELLDGVFTTGERFVANAAPIRLQATPESEPTDRFLDFIYEPIRDEDGIITGIFVEGHDVTDRVQAEVQLRESEARQAFMLELSDALRPLDKPVDIAAEAAARLGKWLGLNRVFYGEISGTKMTVECDYTDGVQSLVGQHDMAAFGDFLLKYRADALIVSEDTQADTRYGEDARTGLLDRQVVAFCDIGLFETGDCVSLMAAQSATTRQWTAVEQSVVREVGGRVKLAIDRANTEQALHESEERLRLVLDAATGGFYSVDCEGNTTLVSRGFIEMMGFKDDSEALGKKLHGLIHHTHPDGSPYPVEQCPIYQCARSGAAAHVPDELFFRPDETAVPVEYWVSPILRDGERIGAICTILDLTQRKAADAALRESEARLRELNDTLEQRVAQRTAERDRMWANSRDLLLVVGADGVFRAVSPAWTPLLGWTAGELVGRSYLDFIHPGDHPSSRDAFATATREGLPLYENRYRHKNGSYRWISWLAVPEGDLIYAYGREVTAEKERQAELETAQEALRQSQKMEAMGQLTGGVAHDFNNLLTPIVGSLDMLQRKGVGGEREQRLIAGALQSADRAKTLVQRLLAFARRQPLQATAVDVDALVTGMADLVASTSGPQIKVVVEGARNLPPAKADANQLEMALLNLGVNARDAMPDGGTLRITAGAERIGAEHRSKLQPGEYIRLSVADTGVGMDEATLNRAVEPFFSTKGVGRGTGLGLSMVHGLASQLGGALTIDSRPGVGTNVELWLPVSDVAAQVARSSEAAVSMSAAQGTVLLVDDEELVRMSTADMLDDMGYVVVEAGCAEEALQLLDQGLHPDLLVTDHLMPGMNGTDLARAVRSIYPAIQILIVSGYAEGEGIDADLPRLTKPFRNIDLTTMLSRLTSTEQTHSGGRLQS